MGIIKISEQMHANLRSTSGALCRSINSQAEHWLRVGMLAELNPAKSYGELCAMLIEAAKESGGQALPLPDQSVSEAA
ncbi:ParD-like family protein [Paraburkholderia sp. GAS42]|uniref:ParD-like family protein n=1 Tax=Paraburkholderia sp. GAS42 TaxID=3035135 RepID=UPI003D1D4795